MIDWHRAEEGHIDSHCGDWMIEPVHEGDAQQLMPFGALMNPRTRVLGYRVRHVPTGMMSDLEEDPTRAKHRAEIMADDLHRTVVLPWSS